MHLSIELQKQGRIPVISQGGTWNKDMGPEVAGRKGGLLRTIACTLYTCHFWLFHRVLWRHTPFCSDHFVTVSSLVAVTGVPSVLSVSCTVGSWAGVPPAYPVGRRWCVPLSTALRGRPHPHSWPMFVPSPAPGSQGGVPNGSLGPRPHSLGRCAWLVPGGFGGWGSQVWVSGCMVCIDGGFCMCKFECTSCVVLPCCAFFTPNTFICKSHFISCRNVHSFAA